MKKCFLYAYDKGNLGDDLFVHTITKRYPHVKFYMWTDKENRRNFRCLQNLRVLNKNSTWVKFLKWLRPSLLVRYRNWIEKRCQAVVYIGGSIFPEYPTWNYICNWWEHKAKCQHFYALGCNFDSYKTEAYRERMSQIYEKMQDVCFRDKYSYGLFKGNDTVRYAPDILFSFEMPRIPVKKKQIFVSILDCAGRDPSSLLDDYDQCYVCNMTGILHGYLEDGYELVLCSFCKEEGDERGIEKILRAMDCVDDPRIKFLKYDGTNIDDIVHAIAGSEYVIATRFHAMVLAMVAGRPVMPIVYSDKTLRVLEDLEFKGTILDLRKNEIWSYTQSRNNLETPSLSNRKKLGIAAKEHFLRLDKVLSER